MAQTLFRYKWLVLLLTILGTAAGGFATRFLQPAYEVQGTIWIAGDGSSLPNAGPIRGGELMSSNSWPDLLRSYAVLDSVTANLHLFVSPDPRDADLFTSFGILNAVRPGRYLLNVDTAGDKYALEDTDGRILETGRLGDSIGRVAGFRWAPPADQLRQHSTVRFSVATLRDVSIQLRNQLRVELPEQGSLLRVSLTGRDARRTAATLNGIIRRFVAAAADLKGRNLVEFSRTLEQQLAYTEGELRSAEAALEDYRVKTITLPSEGTSASGATAQGSGDPVFTNFFQEKVAYDDLDHQRKSLEKTLADVQAGTLDVNALWSVLTADNSSQDLRTALTDYSAKQAKLRADLQVYTEEHKTVRDLRSSLQHLRESTIPQLTQSLIAQLQRREADLGSRLGTTSNELKSIPTRTIEGMRLRRNVEVRAALYTTLRNRYEEAKLAEASAIPDVSILDTAATPLQPTQNRAPQILMAGFAGSIAFAIALALLLDRLDGRFRYPEQVLTDLGLPIIGAVPNTSQRGGNDPTRLAQLVESFRSLRLSISYAIPRSSSTMLCVTSPGPGEGKSLVSANLALAFAEAGYRTALVDGDVRRGGLHSTFGLQRSPGLSDVLRGSCSLGEALRATPHERLQLLPSGSRFRSAPELLTNAVMHRTLMDLRGQFDAIVVDSSPLVAGVDPFAFAATTGHVLLVLRAEKSDLRLTRAKLELLGRLPTRVLGVAINDVKMQGEYRDYSFSPYELDETEEPSSSMTIGQLANKA